MIRFKVTEPAPVRMRVADAVVVGGGGDIATYTGSYTIRPEIDAQILPTQNKRMANDLTVQAIPYYEVSNQHNGQTVIIGGDI